MAQPILRRAGRLFLRRLGWPGDLRASFGFSRGGRFTCGRSAVVYTFSPGPRPETRTLSACITSLSRAAGPRNALLSSFSLRRDARDPHPWTTPTPPSSALNTERRKQQWGRTLNPHADRAPRSRSAPRRSLFSRERQPRRAPTSPDFRRGASLKKSVAPPRSFGFTSSLLPSVEKVGFPFATSLETFVSPSFAAASLSSATLSDPHIPRVT